MKVTLIGAGPGGLGLLTLRGHAILQNADVVLYDSFVGDEILAVIPQSAEKINVGKRAGNHPVPQEEINALLLKFARQGKNVVRLKGGDPFVFGRGGEELQLLADNNIPFEVVPGVTSALGAGAYAGIPLTHRDCSSSLHIFTAHTKNNVVDIDFDAIAKLKGTFVFLMGATAVNEICEGCINGGMDENTPAAIVENATSNRQRKFWGTITSLPNIANENSVVSPAIIIIGDVCRYSNNYDWFAKLPLRGKRAAFARVKSEPSKLAGELRELGCDVVEIPCLKISPLVDNNCALEEKIKDIKNYSRLVFTSGAGVNIFFDYLAKRKIDIRELSGLKIACVGGETEREVNKRGLFVDYTPEKFCGTALAHGLIKLVTPKDKLLIARAKDADFDLTNILSEVGVSFDDVAVYEKICDAEMSITADRLMMVGSFDFAVFTCPSAVECFAEVAARTGADIRGMKAVCIAEKTAAAAKSYGMETYTSTQASVKSMIEKIIELCDIEMRDKL